MTDPRWTAWLNRPIAEREAIQDRVKEAVKAGAQAGRDMMKANGMPTPPAEMVEPVEVTEARHRVEDEDEPWKPVGRVDH